MEGDRDATFRQVSCYRNWRENGEGERQSLRPEPTGQAVNSETSFWKHSVS